MEDHAFRANGESRVLWKWQITCFVEMANRMFRGNNITPSYLCLSESFSRQFFGKYLDIFTCLCFMYVSTLSVVPINTLNPELNPICYLLALLGAHYFLHVSRVRVKLLTFRLLMSYIYIWSTHSWYFQITHNDAAQSVGLLWTSDQLDAETFTWQHTTLTTDKYPCPRWDSNSRSQQASGPDVSPAEILGSNPTGDMDICLLWVSCVVR